MSKCYTMDQRQLSQHDAETGQPCAKRRKWTWTKTWHLFTNINSHWITDLEAKCETIKLPADTEETLDGLECGNDFRANTEGITREKRKRIDRQGKTLSREWKNKNTDWEKIVSKDTSGKTGQRPQQTPHQEDIQTPSKHVQRRSISCVIREIQLKTTRHHCTPTEWFISTALTTLSASKDAEPCELSLVPDGDAKWDSHSGRQFGGFSQN